MPTNGQGNTPPGAATAETRRMIGRWGILHAGRSAPGLIATGLGGKPLVTTHGLGRAIAPIPAPRAACRPGSSTEIHPNLRNDGGYTCGLIRPLSRHKETAAVPRLSRRW